jgi:Homeodomain-like domain
MNLALVGNSILRSAVQRNLVSFPAQVPAFTNRPDSQRRIVQLYFVRRWRIGAICDRYGLSKATVQKLLSEWRIRAVSSGHIQDIHPELIARLAGDEDVRRHDVFEESEPESAVMSPWPDWEAALPPHSSQVVSATERL